MIEILLIDDEPIVGKRLKTALEKSGYKVDVCTSGAEGLKHIQEREFDIVVTDVRMDDVDGMEILNKVNQQSPKTKVIIITGYATIELAREAMAKGAFEFIAKPFKPNDLREVIKRAAEELTQDKS